MRSSIHNIQNEEYYKLVANNINDLVALYSPEGTIEYISPSVNSLLGYSQESLVGISPAPIVHPDDRHFLTIDEHAFREKKDDAFYFEYRLLHKSGHWVYYESFRQPIFNGDGELTNVLAVCRDISQKKEAEQHSKESEDLYRTLANNILDAVAIFDADGIRRYVSPSVFALLGYEPEELVGKHLSNVIHPDDVEKFRMEIQEKAILGKDNFLSEHRSRHKNGQWLYCESTIKTLRDASGTITGYISTTRNINEWKKAQIALKESEEKYRSLVDSSDAIVTMVNRQGDFIFVNNKGVVFLEEAKEFIVGRNIYDFSTKESGDVFLEWVAKVFDESKKVVYEHQTVYRGKNYWLRTTLHPVFNSTSEVYAVMVSTIDITGMKISEDALRKQNDVLKQIAFLQSHIVRSPLTNIQGILYLLDEDGMSEENRYYFQLLKQAAEKLDEVIKEIVDRAVVIRHQTMDIQ